MRPHQHQPNLLDDEKASSPSLVGSPERAGKDAGTNDVQRGRPGVPLKLQWRLPYLCQISEQDAADPEKAFRAVKKSLAAMERLRKKAFAGERFGRLGYGGINRLTGNSNIHDALIDAERELQRVMRDAGDQRTDLLSHGMDGSASGEAEGRRSVPERSQGPDGMVGGIRRLQGSQAD